MHEDVVFLRQVWHKSEVEDDINVRNLLQTVIQQIQRLEDNLSPSSTRPTSHAVESEPSPGCSHKPASSASNLRTPRLGQDLATPSPVLFNAINRLPMQTGRSVPTMLGLTTGTRSAAIDQDFQVN